MRSLFHSPAIHPGLSMHECGATGSTLWGLLAEAWPAPFHNLPPCWVRHLRLAASPLHPGCPSLPLLPVWMNVSFLSFLVVGFPYSSIFCQFWLFFVFKLSLSFFWLCEEAQCVYLHLHLGRKPLGCLCCCSSSSCRCRVRLFI